MEDRWTVYIRSREEKREIENPWIKNSKRSDAESDESNQPSEQNSRN